VDVDYVYTGHHNLQAMREAVNYNRYQYDFIRRQIDRIDETRDVRLLDVGAGIGTYTDMFTGHDRVTVDCVEPDSDQARILQQKGHRVYRDLEDVTGKYDVVYALNVYEHIEDDAAALAEARRCVTDDGVVVIYVPAFMVLFSRHDVMLGHYRRYRVSDMHELARRSGLSLASARYCDPVGFVAALVYRLIGASGRLSPRSVRVFDRYLFPLSVLLEPLTRGLVGKNVLAVFKRERSVGA
jgi:SAM-dependent methyltransferase